LTSRDFGSWYA
nr:Chain C, PEPTIDE ANTAGONIST [synthetic construct]2BJ4_D Chain D, PEPTIDE ANTAGONIST [synthetic construct]